jgi:hypothetical protein
MPRIGHVLLTLWAGGLWTICGVAAPTAFALLTRADAGAIVGRLFAIAAAAGAVIGLALLALIGASTRRRSIQITIAIAALAPVLSEVALGPLMRGARLNGDLRMFGILHGLAAALFLSACLCTLILVWKLNRAK